MNRNNILPDMTTDVMFLRDMKIMMMRDVNMKQGLAKAMLLTLLFLGGRMACEVSTVIS